MTILMREKRFITFNKMLLQESNNMHYPDKKEDIYINKIQWILKKRMVLPIRESSDSMPIIHKLDMRVRVSTDLGIPENQWVSLTHLAATITEPEVNKIGISGSKFHARNIQMQWVTKRSCQNYWMSHKTISSPPPAQLQDLNHRVAIQWVPTGHFINLIDQRIVFLDLGD